MKTWTDFFFHRYANSNEYPDYHSVLSCRLYASIYPTTLIEIGVHIVHCEHEVLFPFKKLEERRLSFYKMLKTNQNCIDIVFLPWSAMKLNSMSEHERWLSSMEKGGWRHCHSFTFLHSLWRYNSCTSCMVGCFGEVGIYVSTMNNLYFVFLFYIYGSLSVTGSVLLR